MHPTPALWGPWEAESEQAEDLLSGWTGQFFQVRTISYLKAFLTALLGELKASPSSYLSSLPHSPEVIPHSYGCHLTSKGLLYLGSGFPKV